jgi:hypothetical protein
MSSLSFLAGEVPVFKKSAVAVGVAASFEVLNGSPVDQAIQSGSIIGFSSFLSHTVLDGVSEYADMILPTSITDSASGLNIDLAANVASGVIYGAATRYLDLSPIPNDSITGFVNTVLYATATTSLSDVICSKM